MPSETLALVKKSFADYLSRPEWNWSWFHTQTFDVHKCGYRKRNGRLAVHREICNESFGRMMNVIAKQAVIVYGFAFGELHRNGFPHWHALLHVKSNLFGQPRRVDVFDYMFRKYGRNKLLEYVPNQNVQVSEGVACVSDGVARYLCKYVAKEAAQGDAWWDFKGFMGGCEADPSQIAAVTGVRQYG